MIVSEAQLRILLGLGSTITDEERAILAMVHPQAEGLVKSYLGYEPQQRTATEYYPRIGPGPQVEYRWTSNGTNAYRQALRGSRGNAIVVERLPIRSVIAINEDSDGRYGQQDGAFDTNGTLLIPGTDYWTDSEQDNVCKSGIIYRTGSWPSEPGTVRVQYVAGYSQLELQGAADTITASTTSDVNDEFTNVGIDASPISRAVALTATKAMNTWQQQRKKTAAGWTAGPLQSEKLGDYSYAAGGNTAELTGLRVGLPPEAAEELEGFIHYARMLT